jgi:glycosyltransferase involved in cell wall biosynthesis
VSEPIRRVLIITQVYEPEPNFITADVARDLAHSAQVTVITAHPNYPTGRFYPGSKWWKIAKSREDGVEVWRVPMWPSHSLSPLLRGLSYLSFAIVAALVAPFGANEPDVIWIYHGPFTAALAALPLKYFSRARTVITFADLWPESFAATGVVRSGAAMGILRRYSRAVNRMADVIICATRGTLERCRRDGIPEDRLRMVPVWIPGIETLSSAKRTVASPSARIVYAGNVGPAQGLESVLRAAVLLKSSHPEVGIDIYGSGSALSELKSLAAEVGATNVQFHGRVPVAEAFERSSGALAQLVTLEPTPLFAMTVPSKLSVAFAAGSPLLFSLPGEAGRLAEESGGAVAFDLRDPVSFVAAVEKLLALSESDRAAMRQRLKDYFVSNFSPSTLRARYRDIIVGPPHSAPRSGFVDG